MTDRELMQMAIDALEQPSPIGGFDNQAYVAKALRNRLEQPEWVGLTDEEVLEEEEFINHRYGKPINHSTAILMDFVKQVEAKLKEKNT